MSDVLGQVQTLQFHDRAAAEVLLLDFVRQVLELPATALELRPLAVSLNSFNGFLTLDDGRRLFFKSHTEPDNVIGEYYHASALADVGYPVLQPIISSTEAGKQFLIYEVIDDPSVFDIAWKIENDGDDSLLPDLTQAQNAADDALYSIYKETRQHQTAESAALAPVHQLFYHRLVYGRMSRFYGDIGGETPSDVSLLLPDTGALPMKELSRKTWRINGQHYDETLETIVRRAISLLVPAQAGPSIVGHGDAHNGNVFFRQHTGEPTLLYFDPAFAGRHHPLLDLTKPLFHNVFAMWMYFPDVKRNLLSIRLREDDNTLIVDHDFSLPPVREMFLNSKLQRVLIPTVQALRKDGTLRADWRAFLKAALFCCPFLTMNLADQAKFSPEISLLGLSMAVEMGSESQGERSRIDRALDEVEAAIS